MPSPMAAAARSPTTISSGCARRTSRDAAVTGAPATDAPGRPRSTSPLSSPIRTDERSRRTRARAGCASRARRPPRAAHGLRRRRRVAPKVASSAPTRPFSTSAAGGLDLGRGLGVEPVEQRGRPLGILLRLVVVASAAKRTVTDLRPSGGAGGGVARSGSAGAGCGRTPRASISAIVVEDLPLEHLEALAGLEAELVERRAQAAGRRRAPRSASPSGRARASAARSAARGADARRSAPPARRSDRRAGRARGRPRIRSSSAATRRSSSRPPSICANGSGANSARAGPRQSCERLAQQCAAAFADRRQRAPPAFRDAAARSGTGRCSSGSTSSM